MSEATQHYAETQRMGLNRRRIYSSSQTTSAPSRLWLQAKLSISLTSIQDKLRGRIETLEAVFQAAARNFTVRLAEKLAKYLCSLMRRAETLATPETECLLYATYWFRPILSELIGAATANVNRDRAPSGWLYLRRPGCHACGMVCCDFFSVQRLHGFRQVVQHVQLHVAK